MSWRTTLVAPQRRQSALLEPPLMTSHGAHRTIEHPGRSDLIGPALFHQAHHRQRFGHAIGHCILGQDHARNDHHSVAVLRSDQAAFIDDARAVGVAGLRKQVRGWESRHIRRRYGAGQKSGQVWVRTLLQPGLPESPEKSGNPKRYVRSSGVYFRDGTAGLRKLSRQKAAAHGDKDAGVLLLALTPGPFLSPLQGLDFFGALPRASLADSLCPGLLSFGLSALAVRSWLS